MPNPPNNTPDKALVEAARFMRHDGLCGIVGGYDVCTCGMEAAKDAIERLSQPQHGGLVEALGLEWSEDGYSLRTPYDGDVDGDGRHVVVGGETVITFADSDEGDKARDAIRAALSNSPVVGEDAPAMINNTNHALPTGVWKPTPTDTADRREAVALVREHLLVLRQKADRKRRAIYINAPDLVAQDKKIAQEYDKLADAIASLIAGPPEGFYTEDQRDRAINELSALRNRGHDEAPDAVDTVLEAIGLQRIAARPTGDA